MVVGLGDISKQRILVQSHTGELGESLEEIREDKGNMNS